MRIIGHLDMDAFFASVEERDHPRFAGKPIVVGADPQAGRGRGVVSTANYAARKYGIKSALPISTAWRFSEEARKKGLPPAIFLEGSYAKYGEESRRVMEILRKHVAAVHGTAEDAPPLDPMVEVASVDEAYFDLSPAGSYEEARKIAAAIKEEIKERERLTASVGIGPNKLIAKIASDAQKPDGLTIVSEAEAEKFIEPMSVRVIPGIGPKAEEQFKRLRIRTVGEARKLSLEQLQEMMGKWGSELYEKLRARSESPIVEEWEAKSIGEQETFETDTRDPAFLQEHLKDLADDVHRRFAESGFKSYRGVTITVRFADFTTKTRSSTLKKDENNIERLQFESLRLFMPFLDSRENPKKKAIRLVGVRVEKLK